MTSDLRVVFALAAIPAALAVATLVLGVREEPRRPSPRPADEAPPSTGSAPLEPALGRYLGVLALFTLGNSSDAFLLLRAQETGVALAAIPALWALHHLVKSAASTWGGALSDRVGRRRVILAGWGVYALAYAGFAVAGSPLAIVALFAFYGLFHALTEGAERALVADLAGEATRGPRVRSLPRGDGGGAAAGQPHDRAPVAALRRTRRPRRRERRSPRSPPWAAGCSCPSPLRGRSATPGASPRGGVDAARASD